MHPSTNLPGNSSIRVQQKRLCIRYEINLLIETIYLAEQMIYSADHHHQKLQIIPVVPVEWAITTPAHHQYQPEDHID